MGEAPESESESESSQGLKKKKSSIWKNNNKSKNDAPTQYIGFSLSMDAKNIKKYGHDDEESKTYSSQSTATDRKEKIAKLESLVRNLQERIIAQQKDANDVIS